MKNDVKRAVVYLRVSTEGQAVEGVSLGMQESRCRAWCEAGGHVVAGVFADEGISGKSMLNRPGLASALVGVGKGGTLVVYSLSRLARNTRDLLDLSADLEGRGVNLASVTDSVDTGSATGRLFFTLMAALATFEREQIGERTSAALRHKRSRGERFTRFAPVGHRWEGGRMVVDEAGMARAVRAADAVRAGGTLRVVASDLGMSVKAVRVAVRGMAMV